MRPSPEQHATANAFWEPKPGMLFHEAYSYWMYVVDVTDDVVTILQSGAPCTFPDGDSIEAWRGTVDELHEKYAYKGGGLGFWISFHSDGNDVTGWVDHAEKLLRRDDAAHASSL